MARISFPYNWKPRSYQKPLWNYFMAPGNRKRASVFWHRRAGKDLLAMNLIAVKAHQRVGAYWHVFPENKQGRKIAWTGRTKGIINRDTGEVKEQGRTFLDYLGGAELRDRCNDQEMVHKWKNGSSYQVVNAQSDSLVGGNPVGIVFSEWALMKPDVWNYLLPILAENGGWALFITTPRGKNHAFTMHEMAKDNPEWFQETLIAGDSGTLDDDGRPVISDKEIQAAKDGGMEEEKIRSEFFCDTDAPVSGAYYGRQMMVAQDDGRVCSVPWDPKYAVYTAWDIGTNDATSIWFFQRVSGGVHVIDYHEENEQPLSYHIKVVKDKPYTYETHFAPHDIEKREITSNEQRIVTAMKLGLRFTPLPMLSVQERIDATRNLIPVCHFDATKCADGIESLRQYKKKWDERQRTFLGTPDHDWASNGADAFGYYALAAGSRPGESRRPNSKQVIVDNYDYLEE